MSKKTALAALGLVSALAMLPATAQAEQNSIPTFCPAGMSYNTQTRLCWRDDGSREAQVRDLPTTIPAMTDSEARAFDNVVAQTAARDQQTATTIANAGSRQSPSHTAQPLMAGGVDTSGSSADLVAGGLPQPRTLGGGREATNSFGGFGGTSRTEGCSPESVNMLQEVSSVFAESEMDRMLSSLRVPESVTELSCLDRILGFNGYMTPQIPSLGSIINQIKGRLCQVAEGYVRQMMQPVNGMMGQMRTPNMSLPGGITLPGMGVNTGVRTGATRSGGLVDYRVNMPSNISTILQLPR